MLNNSNEIASRAQDEFLLTIEKLNAIVGEDIGASGEADFFSGAGLLSDSGRELNEALLKFDEATKGIKTAEVVSKGTSTSASIAVFGKTSAEPEFKGKAVASATAVAVLAGRNQYECSADVSDTPGDGGAETSVTKEKGEIEREGREKIGELEKSAAENEAKGLAAHEAESRMYHKSTWNLRAKSVTAGAGAATDMLEALYTAFGFNSKILFEAMRVAAIAETVVQTIIAVRGAYEAFKEVPPPAGPALIAAATVAALTAGAARVMTIAKTRPGDANATIDSSDTSPPSYPIGLLSGQRFQKSGMSVTAKKAEPDGVVAVVIDKLSEAAWAEVVEDDLIPALNDAAMNRNVRISVKAFA